MIVRLFAALRDLAGESELELDAPAPSVTHAHPRALPATLGDLIEALAARYGPAFRRAVLDGERLRPAVVVLINGRNARSLGGADAPLAPRDEISIFPPLGGG